MGKIADTFNVSGAKDSDMVLALSGTDWEPETYQVGAVGKSATGPFKCIVNPTNDQIMGTVRGRWQANSHVESIRSLDSLIRQGTILPHNVSVWDHGAIIAYQFSVPELNMVIRAKDVVSPLFTLAFWHDGKGGDRAFFADFRWFCKNQLGQVSKLSEGSVRHGSTIRERYTELLTERIGDIRTDLGDRYKAMQAMTAKELVGKPMLSYMARHVGVDQAVIDMAYNVGDGSFSATLPDSVGRSEKAQHKVVLEALDCWDIETEEEGKTVWAAYNAVTRYLTHCQGRNEAGRSQRMLLGQGSDLANKAFEEAVELAA